MPPESAPLPSHRCTACVAGGHGAKHNRQAPAPHVCGTGHCGRRNGETLRTPPTYLFDCPSSLERRCARSTTRSRCLARIRANPSVSISATTKTRMLATTRHPSIYRPVPRHRSELYQDSTRDHHQSRLQSLETVPRRLSLTFTDRRHFALGK